MNYYLKKIINQSYDFLIPKCFSRHFIKKIRCILIDQDPLFITYICTGNICRSAFCEHEFSGSQISFDKIKRIDSAGIYTSSGKNADSDAIKYANDFAVSLSSHITTKLSFEKIYESSIIFVMEPWQLIYITFKHPALSHKTFLLSSFKRYDLQSWSIQDPFQKDKDTFYRVFSVLRDCNEELRKIITTINS